MGIHTYSTAFLPQEPLEIGMTIRIMATTPAWYAAPEEEAETYETYDAHIVGIVTRIVGWKRRKLVLEVENYCALNAVRTARLRIPLVPDVTVKIEAAMLRREWYEAQESDLNTAAVVRNAAGGPRCGAHTCRLPWRELVGEGFLAEPMLEDVGNKPGCRRGKKKRTMELTSWEALAAKGL